MALFGGLNAGSIFVEYGFKPDKRSQREYDDAMARARRKQKETQDQFRKGSTGWWDQPRDELGRFVKRSEQGSAQFQRALESSHRSAKRVSRSFNRIAMVGFAGVTAAAAGAVKKFIDFDSAMTQSTAIMGKLSQQQMREMEETAKKVSMATKFSATQAAEAYYFLASAGLDAGQSMKALPSLARFAQAGQFDLARATDLLTDAQSALGLSSKDAGKNLQNLNRVADVSVKANVLANASVEQFSEALTNKAGSAARLLNKDMEEVVAVLALFADQGLKGAAAGEAVAIVMRDLQRSAIKEEAAFKRANVAVFDQAGKMRNLADIVKDLERATGSLSDKQKREFFTTLGFQDRSISNMLMLIGGSNRLRKYEQDLRRAGGTTAEVAAKQTETLKEQLQILRNTVDVVAISLVQGMEPQLMRITKGIQKSFQDSIPSVVAFSERIGKILDGPGSFSDKLGRIAGELQKSGLPEKVSALLVKAFSTAAEGAVKTFISVFKNSNAWGKGILATILLIKLAPLATGLATLITKGFMMARIPRGLGGATGGLPGAGIPGKPVPVFVTNMAPGGMGGAGGAGAAARGAGFGAATTAGALMRGVGIAGLVIGVNELFNHMGWPNSRSIGAWLGRLIKGDAAKIQKNTDAHQRAQNKIGWAIKNPTRNAGGSIGDELKAMVASKDQERARQSIQQTVQWLAKLEAQGKVAAGSTEAAIARMGTSAAIYGVNAKSAIAKAREEIAKTGPTAQKTAATTDRATNSMTKQLKRPGAAAEQTARKTHVEMLKTTKAVKDQEAPIGKALKNIGGFFAGLWSKVSGAGKAAMGWIERGARRILPGMATGGYISGPRGAGVPVTLHGDEAVLNSEQMALVGRERVMAALEATGAPTLRAGGGYSRGLKPRKKNNKKKPAKKKPNQRGGVDRRNPVIPLQDRFDDDMRELEGTLAQNELTKTVDDDNQTRSLLRSRISRRLDFITSLLGKPANSRRKWPEMWRLLTETKTDLTRSLKAYEPLQDFGADDVSSEIDKQNPAVAASIYAAAKMDLFRQWGGNTATAGPGGAFAGANSSATVNNYFPTPPPDPHAFARGLAFDLRGAL